jgi:hypothetical protein
MHVWSSATARFAGSQLAATVPAVVSSELSIKSMSSMAVSMSRGVLLYVVVAIIVAVLIWGARRIFFRRTHTRSVTADVVQGILVGAVLAFITVLFILPRFYITTVNGWTTMFGCGAPGSGVLLRAACNVTFMGPINVPQEAMYWATGKDGAGHTLSGAHDYRLHFAAGQLPPHRAFWSLTMGDAGNHFVANRINRYSVSDRSGLVPNADGSVDIYIQATSPTDHESNWLPAPTGKFILWLRVYLPGQTVLDGEYTMPPVVQIS